MNEVQGKARVVKASIALLLIASLAAFVSGCWPFNEAPLALFTASTLSGTAPLSVSFSAILSSDSDGIIVAFDWDFGDGSSGSGESVSHTYTTAGTRSVVLRVTDDDGARATASKTITVNPADTNGGDGPGTSPTASFTATPLTGPAPLTVTFNASASSHAGFTITAYFWTFDDGTTGAGMTTTHSYAPSATRTYHVVLRIISSDNNKEATTSKDLIVTVSGATPPSNAPTASFSADHNSVIAPLPVTFDPSGSGAGAGRTLTTYFWTYGDGTTPTSSTSNAKVTHRFVTDHASEDFIVTLTVIDNKGSASTTSRTITVENKTPVAGFEIYRTLGVADPGPAAGDPDWKRENVTFYSVTQTGSHKVWFQSKEPTGWQNTTPAPGTDPTPKTGTPGNYTGNNLSYDPEGQGWSAGTPAGFPSVAWGIMYVEWDFGDGVLEIQGTGTTHALFAPIDHTYDFTSGLLTKTVKITAVDYLGQRTTFTRQITFSDSSAP